MKKLCFRSKKRRISAAVLAACVLIACAMTVSGEPQSGPEISVGNVTASPGETVSVPITVSGSPGVCGATVSVSYDSALTLKSITKGGAWPTLTMTKPGKLTATTLNIVWDGTDADLSDGIIATLEFTAPDTPGTYNISVSYGDGNIVDGNLNPVDFALTNGCVKVESTATVTVGISDRSVSLKGDNLEGSILVSFYRGNRLISVRFYPVSEAITVDDIPFQALRAKIMWWRNMISLSPVCEQQEIDLN